MGLSNSLEPKLGWLAFPGLIRGITIIHVMMFLLLLFRGEDARATIALFEFHLDKILTGEVWRVISFLLLPPRFGSGALGVLVMFFAMMIAFLVNDSLEQSWGTFRTSLYCYGIAICQILANTGLNLAASSDVAAPFSRSGGFYFYVALILAFATTFPRYEFRLFFILPVQVWVIGVIIGVIGLLQIFTNWVYALYLYFCFLPYLVWAVPRFLKWAKEREHSATRRADFRARSKPPGESFHTCENCGATDLSHPDRDFRITEDNRELCDACLAAEADDRGPVEKTT